MSRTPKIARTARQRHPARQRRSARLLLPLASALVLAWAWQSAPPTLVRGPYLQSPGTTGITVVFRTSSAAAGVVRYGPQQGPPWEFEKTSPSGTRHVVTLTGLQPDTRYYYSVGAADTVLAAGAGTTFRTAPPAQSRAPFSFFAWGDSGNGTSGQLAVAARMAEAFPQPDFAIGLGDLVYENGEWENYDPHLFRPYAAIFPHLPFWPALGNHDYRTENGAPYYDAFVLPTGSGAPGHACNTEKYYSFDHGMAHFVCLDSESSDSRPGSPMYEWAADDLDDARARGKRWLIVYMHHPPYSAGTHDSDTDPELIELRQNLVPLFESRGVDLVLTGHSHVFERSYLARDDGILQHDPREYTKIGSPDGTIYLVNGCGGETGSGTLDEPLMAVSRGNVLGYNRFEVGWEELRGSFVEDDGRTTDLFRVKKAADGTPPRVRALRASGAAELELAFDEPVRAAEAENAGNYLMLGAAVLEAELESDLCTVRLRTTALRPGRAYPLAVLAIADPRGNVARDLRSYVVPGPAPGGGTSTVVPRGATWRYFKGTSAPPSSWAARTFVDSSWSQGPAGFGFGDGDDATALSDMMFHYVSLYTRASFSVSDPAAVSGLFLNLSYDDGFVAFLNGVEVARVGVAAGQTYTSTAVEHEAAGFEPFDLSAHLSLLQPGTNVLAVEGHNLRPENGDFSLHPELLLSLSSGPATHAPRPVLDCAVDVANAPARIAFSGARSRDADGPLRFLVWDFGDGSRRELGPEVEHVYLEDGLYQVTLLVRDRQGLDALETRTLRVHSQGDAPRARLTASATQVAVGTRVDFSAAASLDPDGGALTLQWDFGDPLSGAADHASQSAVAHVFARVGTYTVRLVVTDDEGSRAEERVTIAVH